MCLQHWQTWSAASIWQDIHERMQAAARRGVTVEETLSCIRQPWWTWPDKLYQDR